MMTEMAAQGLGLGEHMPQMAQTLYVLELGNCEDASCRGRVFISPAAFRGCVWLICRGPLVSPGWPPGRDTEAAA